MDRFDVREGERLRQEKERNWEKERKLKEIVV